MVHPPTIKLISITVIQVYPPNTDAGVEHFYGNLQLLVDVTQKDQKNKKDLILIRGDCNANTGSKMASGIMNLGSLYKIKQETD